MSAPVSFAAALDAPIEQAIRPRARDLGGFSVRRVLPAAERQMVGPFIFFDHLGPARFEPGQGMDVRPHPHIGLATVTYLMQGRILHRDSLANVQPIDPGEMNLMTAGAGIVHSERTPPAQRAGGQAVLGLQSWVALPRDREEIAPDFQHYDAEALPTVADLGVTARVITGRVYGAVSPVTTQSDWFYVDLRLAPGKRAPFDADYEERALYLVEGAIEIEGQIFDEPQMLVLRRGAPVTITATSAARMMLLGGAPLDGERYIWWNLVSSSRERIAQAKADWRAGRFTAVPGESEFIPLPEE